MRTETEKYEAIVKHLGDFRPHESNSLYPIWAIINDVPRHLNVTVDSSNLARVEWFGEAARMVVTFQNGGRYSYRDVPYDVVRALLGAPSVGSYFNSIKNNYSFERIS